MADLDPSAPLCVCGLRGCDLAALHATAFIQLGSRARRGTIPRRRGGRRKR